MLFAKSLLPESMANSLTKELDKATSQVEAETRIPLAEMLTGEKDAQHSGWVSLRRCLMTGDKLDLKIPQLWMQVYVLPDYENLVPTLNNEYEAEGNNWPNFTSHTCKWRPQAPTAEPPMSATDSLASSSAKKAVKLKTLVPPGITPGQWFTINAAPKMHSVTCPPNLKEGDMYAAVDCNGQCVQVQIPPGISAGQKFTVAVSQVVQVQCPPDAKAGEIIEVEPKSNVVHAICPDGGKAGEEVEVNIIETDGQLKVTVPAGAQPGQRFAILLQPQQVGGADPMNPLTRLASIDGAASMISVPGVDSVPSMKLVPNAPRVAQTPNTVSAGSKSAPLQATLSTRTAAASGYPPAVATAAPLQDLLTGDAAVSPQSGKEDLLSGEVTEAICAPTTQEATGTLPGDLFSIQPSKWKTKEQKISDVDLAALYKDSPPLQPEVPPIMPAMLSGLGSAATVEAPGKFAALMDIGAQPDSLPQQQSLVQEAVPDASQPPESFKALQDSLISGFESGNDIQITV
jgi:hypothetical protein